MQGTMGMDANVAAAKALGRCYGGLLFAVFGGLWLLLSAYVFSKLNALTATALAVAVIAYVIDNLRVMKSTDKQAAESAYSKAERKRNNKGFGIVNAVTWIGVFGVISVFPTSLAVPSEEHAQDGHGVKLAAGSAGEFLSHLAACSRALCALAVIMVGLHFFPMPPLYRHKANLATGAVMVAWGLGCIALFEGDERIAWASLGAGLSLWVSAIWALRTAARLVSVHC